MKKNLITILWCSFFFVAMSTSQATLVQLFKSTTSSTFGMGTTETRETHFQALNSVNVSQLAAEIDPSGTAQIRWRIFNSNASGSFLTTIFDSGTLTISDVGMSTYTTNIPAVSLAQSNFYILSMQRVNGNAITMRRYNESTQGLSFTTTDGNFLVIDGKANNNGNSILPSFSMNVGASNPVPEPGTYLLLTFGLTALFIRRK